MNSTTLTQAYASAPALPTTQETATTGTPKRFVAIMGGGGESWAIYVGGIMSTSEWIESDGDKACTEDHIKQLINCDETLAYYRF